MEEKQTEKEEVKEEGTAWKPKTDLGKRVKAGEITDIEEVVGRGMRILEPEITESLMPDMEVDIFRSGQSKGKFGGGKSSIWKQTQKKTKEGNKPKFSAIVVVGNRHGYVGIGKGKAKETVPAREKATRRAKLDIIKVKRGSGSWESNINEPHSIPFRVEGKCGSVRVKLMPAPKGTGLRVEGECAKMLELAGIKDIYSKTRGKTGTKINLIYACFDALKKLTEMKVGEEEKIKDDKHKNSNS
ncbi:30S ribosomal protein S5 [Candidatus Woesearchaeota archaeon]|nr:30S ribosomal protein S5 [Candidatus Woesearchaeota archaeon]